MNGKNKIYKLYSPGGKIPYAGKTIPLNVHVNNNQLSPYRNFSKYVDVW